MHVKITAIMVVVLANIAVTTANKTVGPRHHHGPEKFTEAIFEKYGHDGVISLEDLNSLISGMGAGGHDNHERHEYKDHYHAEHDHSEDSSNRTDHNHHDHQKNGRHVNDSRTRGIVQCINASEILAEFNIDPEVGIMSHAQFQIICPALVYQQLENKYCGNSEEVMEDHYTWIAWVSATICTLGISITGFMCVLTVRFLVDKHYFKSLVQFLVAMGVGALSGDALLHLLPHALTPHLESGHVHHHDHGESEAVWKGLVAFGGIFSFFITQRLLQLRNMRSKAKKNGVTVPMSDKPPESDDLLNRKYGRTNSLNEIREHNRHFHSHSHQVPVTLSSVVWMVIVGDGMHNFIDGLAIGAAFSESIMGGVGTCVAVLCHELPHELGDFAMLLQKGMSVKRALQFNCLSSVVCFVGTAVGLSLGNVGHATSWIFALAGGIFLYLALVTMMPELNLETTEDNCATILLLQCAGLLLGSVIMLVIAIYEHDMQHITFW